MGVKGQLLPPQAIETLMSLGIKSRDARLYVALLHATEATPAMLHRISGVPRTKTYETLDRMVVAGLCRERLEGRRKYYHAVRPTEVIASLQRSWKTQQESRSRLADETFAGLDQLYLEATATDPGLDQIEVIRSRDQIDLKFLQLAGDCQRELISFVRSPYTPADTTACAEQKRVQSDLLARDVRVVSVYMVEADDWHGLQGFIADLEKAGEDVRLSDSLPIKMYIFDRQRVLIALPSVPGQTVADFTMLAVADPGFAAGCVVLFETYWAKAETGPQWFARRNAAADRADQARA